MLFIVPLPGIIVDGLTGPLKQQISHIDEAVLYHFGDEAEQMAIADIEELSFGERLGLLINREMTSREDRRLQSHLRRAKLRHNTCIEEIDYRPSRGLDKSLLLDLVRCQWIKQHLNLLITGPTGVGKTWIACALAHKACCEGYTPPTTCACRNYCRNCPLPRAMVLMSIRTRNPLSGQNLLKSFCKKCIVRDQPLITYSQIRTLH